MTALLQARSCDSDSLPTPDQISALPRWARIAFAAHCARRVLTLCQTPGAWLSDKQIAAIERAVQMTEDAAAHAEQPSPDARAVAARAACAASEYATNAAAARAGYAAAYAAYAYAYAGESDCYIGSAAEYAAFAYAIGYAYIPRAGSDIAQAMQHDLNHLAMVAEEQNWDDGTPVSPDFFGRLWPHGEPRWTSSHAA